MPDKKDDQAAKDEIASGMSEAGKDPKAQPKTTSDPGKSGSAGSAAPDKSKTAQG